MWQTVWKYLSRFAGKTTAGSISLLIAIIVLNSYTDVIDPIYIGYVSTLLLFVSIGSFLISTVVDLVILTMIKWAKAKYKTQQAREGNFIDDKTLEKQYKEETLTNSFVGLGKSGAKILIDSLKEKITEHNNKNEHEQIAIPNEWWQLLASDLKEIKQTEKEKTE